MRRTIRARLSRSARRPRQTLDLQVHLVIAAVLRLAVHASIIASARLSDLLLDRLAQHNDAPCRYPQTSSHDASARTCTRAPAHMHTRGRVLGRAYADGQTRTLRAFAHCCGCAPTRPRRLRANGLFKSKAFGDLCSAVGSESAAAQSPEAVKALLPSLAPKLAAIFTAAPLPPLSPSQIDRLGEVRKGARASHVGLCAGVISHVRSIVQPARTHARTHACTCSMLTEDSF